MRRERLLELAQEKSVRSFAAGRKEDMEGLPNKRIFLLACEFSRNRLQTILASRALPNLTLPWL